MLLDSKLLSEVISAILKQIYRL